MFFRKVFSSGAFLLGVLLALAWNPAPATAQEGARPLQLMLEPSVPDHRKKPSSPQPGAAQQAPSEQLAYAPPKEPVFEKIVYLKIDSPGSLGERVERLLHGIRVDIPPAYDHFGHEIRRYMAGVGGPQILGSHENLKAQIRNVNNAKIVARYWREAMMAEVAEIEKQIEAEDASSSTRMIFKFNRGVVQAFFAELESWLNVNRAMLDMLLRIGPDRYSYADPVLTFRNQEDMAYFSNLYRTREKALQQIRTYTPFRMMIY